jgi:uncharacterized DUF497 family protein
MLRWSSEKDQDIRQRRGVSFETIEALFLAGDYDAIVKHPTRPNQQILILKIDGYTWCVPFVLEEDGSMFLKTAYPSRKLHREYGGSK